MIGIVVVSHSRKLAEGVLELAEQMTRGKVVIQAAGGIDDPENPIGTDPMQVMAAIESVAAATEDGVLIIMDLGSALMSAETALEFLPDEVKEKVMLCSAPIVEGTLAAAVQASVGASLQVAGTEAREALNVKIEQLAPMTGESLQSTEAHPESSLADDKISIELVINNKLGLHARPAARLVATSGKFKSRINIQKEDKSASAKSINQVALLAVKKGEKITVTASGDDAGQALDALQALQQDNFGERDEDIAASKRQTPKIKQQDDSGAGLPGAEGYAIGPAYVHQIVFPRIERRNISDDKGEIKRLETALDQALIDIKKLRIQTEKTSGKHNAAIFDVHALILKDKDIYDKTVAAISSQKINAEYAWHEVMNAMAEDYRNLDVPYMQARAADVLDCAGRVLGLLGGRKAQGLRLTQKSIIVAHDLSPTDVAGLEPGQVLGLITEIGGITSHAAILARSMGIPAVVGTGPIMNHIANNGDIALDGFTGRIWIEPKPEVQAQIKKQREKWLSDREKARAEASQTARTVDGREIMVMGNIGIPADAPRALEFGAEGIGLFRSEFLFQDREQAPDENEQFAAYVEAAQAMQGRPVIIRSLDVGGDKPLKYLDIPQEDNPFLGERGVRFCLARPELFCTQLRALIRAASQENIWIMYPMISDVQELKDILRLQSHIRQELVADGLAIQDTIKTGIMIEVPSAVAVADQLAELCDFFSIGTNDLTQYVMAADRGNSAVSKLCDSLNPAVLRMIKMTCEAARKAGIEVGICGELAGNALATPLLLGLGLNELSMNAPAIPAVKKSIRAIAMDKCRVIAQKAMQAQSADQVRRILEK